MERNTMDDDSGIQEGPAVSAPTGKKGAAPRQQEVEQCTQWLADYGDDLLAYALTRVHDLDVAEDLVQETYLAAFQAVDRFDGRSSACTWLIGILRHKVADFFRRVSRFRREILTSFFPA